jgi:hypothetical protein
MRSASSLSIDELESIATGFGIDLSKYGSERGAPKPRPYGPEVYEDFHNRFTFCIATDFDSFEEYRKARDILATIYQKQESRMTENQHRFLAESINVAHYRVMARRHRPDPPTETTPQTTPETTQESPMPQTQTQTQTTDAQAEAAQALARLMASMRPAETIDESKIIELIKKHAGQPAHVKIDLRTGAGPKPADKDELIHYKLPMLAAAVNAGVNVMLVGGAGSGKTTACEQVAKILELPFYFTGALDSPYKLLGFFDAQGRLVRTPFREAFEHGGLFLYDELDASLAGAVLPFNAATANRVCDFPDRTIKAHENFRAVAACNTFGRGADRQYVGRLQQDAAVLDRYAMLTWDIDAALESAMVGAPRPEGAPLPQDIVPIMDDTEAHQITLRWLAAVHNVRDKITAHKIRHIVSPRATVIGAKLLCAGWPWADVEESVLYKGLDSDSRTKLTA